MPKNSKTLANRKGLPSAKPVIPAHIQSMKRTSKHCPALNQVIGVMEPGDCDASDIYDFTGDGEEVHALFECDYKLEAGTPVTVYGYLGLSDSSKLMLVVQILEFTDPSPSEPEYIDLTSPATTEQPTAAEVHDTALEPHDGPATSSDDEDQQKFGTTAAKENEVTNPFSRPVSPPLPSQPSSGTDSSGSICGPSSSESAVSEALGGEKGKPSEPTTAVPVEDPLAKLQRQMNAMRSIHLSHFEMLAAKILKRVVSKDLPGAESHLYRRLEEPKRSKVAEAVQRKGYADYSAFSKLADEITNSRHGKAHFSNKKSFLASVNDAKFEFESLYEDELRGGGYNKSREYFVCIRDIFDMYDVLEKLFE